MKIIFFSVLSTLVLINFSFNNAVQNFDWLLGNWKISNKKGVTIEQWKKQNDSLYIGFSASVKAKDTIVEETIELKKVDKNWFYIPTHAVENGGNPVAFKIIFSKSNEMICENKLHDFPTRIAYRRTNNYLFASIEGYINDEFKKINFDYVKDSK